MKVKVSQIISARNALLCMNISCSVPYKLLREIRVLKEALEKEAAAAGEAQNDLVSRLNGVVSDTGAISFSDASKREIFEKSWQEILGSEIELPLDKLRMDGYTDNIVFSNINADIDSLSVFIDFDSKED